MSQTSNKPHIVEIATDLAPEPESAPAPEPVPIAKPAAFDLTKFASKRGAAIAGVETLQTALPVHRISDANDFVRLHPDDDPETGYWSVALCFVNVPIKGQARDTLHLIDEDLARELLPSKRILSWHLALASKPWDSFFLCQVPATNLDNQWNATNVMACQRAMTHWVQATSRKAEGVEAYKIDLARHADAFPEPKWPSASLSELIATTFAGRMIDQEQHPGLLRLIGDKQDVS